MEWISVKDKLPELYQSVAFIVESSDEFYNGRRLGGTYQGSKRGYHGFAVPGIEFSGSHWMPLPEPPTQD